VPTLWIVLGPVGQSIAAANGLAGVDPSAAPVAQLYGLAAWGFALLWLGIAVAVTTSTVRTGLPFSLAWWSFTFPVGTVVPGTSALAARTGLAVFGWAAVALYFGLVVAWAVVLVRTAANVKRLLR
jgi:tellurite resistance protein TehA-like permease